MRCAARRGAAGRSADAAATWQRAAWTAGRERRAALRAREPPGAPSKEDEKLRLGVQVFGEAVKPNEQGGHLALRRG